MLTPLEDIYRIERLGRGFRIISKALTNGLGYYSYIYEKKNTGKTL
ncbi:MAG: hypothetical protein V1872_14010 [bacterium]